MKKIITLWGLFLLSVNIVCSQEETSTIYLGVFVPEQMEDLNPSQLSKINTKIEQLCSKSGISSGYTLDGFSIYPIFEIYDEEVVEGGMQNVYSIKAEMTLCIKQYNGIMVGSVSKTYKGFGNTRNKAIVSAIQNINTSDVIYSNFMKDAKEKIIQYYSTHCEQIKAKANILSKQQKFEEAIALLMSIPECASCYSSLSELIEINFESYHNQICAEQLNKAKSAFALKNYEGVVEAISKIDPSANCAFQADALMKSVKEKITEEEKERLLIPKECRMSIRICGKCFLIL